MLVREIHLIDDHAVDGLRTLLRKAPKLALLIRSICQCDSFEDRYPSLLTYSELPAAAFGPPNSLVRYDDGVAQDSSLLALAELCTECNIGRVAVRVPEPTGANALAKPMIAMSKRLLHLQYPTILRLSGESFGNRIIVPNSASSALLSSPNTITHLAIEGTEMKDFDDDHDGFDGPPEEQFPNLTDITFLNLDIGVGWIASLFLYRDPIGRLKRLNLHNVTNSDIMGYLLRKGGAASCLEEFIWFDSEEEPISNASRAIVT